MTASSDVRDHPFRILILGDFSGRANRRVSGRLTDRRARLVDRDDLDEVLGQMQPELDLAGLKLAFQTLDDFHPDRIYQQAAFQRLIEQPREEPVAPAPIPALRKTSGSLLDDMIDDAAEDAPPDPIADLAGYLKHVVKPHLAQREDPVQKARAAQTESIASGLLRNILHHPHFQTLEAAWRGVNMLTQGLDTDGDLKIHIFDATLEELVRDPSGMETLLKGHDGPWSIIGGNYVFGQSELDAKVLSILGKMAQGVGTPFLAESTVPSSEVSDAWRELRRSPVAHSIGLALPRFLLRLPYGKKTSPIESFDFDELPESVHEKYLWGNPIFCCAYLLGQSFLQDGWSMRPGTHREIRGLPLHVYGSEMKPCAEILMTEKDAGYLMEQGIMPVASLKEQDAVLVVRFQSISDPVSALAGGWAS